MGFNISWLTSITYVNRWGEAFLKPLREPPVRYRESILLGYTSTTRKELRKLTKEMKKVPEKSGWFIVKNPITHTGWGPRSRVRSVALEKWLDLVDITN